MGWRKSAETERSSMTCTHEYILPCAHILLDLRTRSRDDSPQPGPQQGVGVNWNGPYSRSLQTSRGVFPSIRFRLVERIGRKAQWHKLRW
jgi:hypothetical protein